MKKSISIIFMSLFVAMEVSAGDENGIFPYDHNRDKQAIEEIIVRGLPDIFSNSPFYPNSKTTVSCSAHAQEWTNHFNKCGRDTLSNAHVSVMRDQGKTAGYIYYRIPSSWGIWKAKQGIIAQLGVHEHCRGKELGEKLCNHALAHFQAKGLISARVLTTTHDIGQKFYEKKLGFQYYTHVSTFPTGSTTYIWTKKLVPTSPSGTIFNKIVGLLKK